MKKTVGFSLKPKTIEKIKRIADKEDMTNSEVVERCVEQFEEVKE